MKLTAIVSAASLMICVAPFIRASQDPAPSVTPDTIGGLWERAPGRMIRAFFASSWMEPVGGLLLVFPSSIR